MLRDGEDQWTRLRYAFQSSPAPLTYSTRLVGGTMRKLTMLAAGQNTQPARNTGMNELCSFSSACRGALPCAEQCRHALSALLPLLQRLELPLKRVKHFRAC